MNPKAAGSPEPERLFDLLEPLLAAETLPALLDLAAASIGQLTEAHAVAVFVTDGQSVVSEAWHGADEARRGRLRPHFLGLTHQAVKTGEPVVTPFPAGAADGLEPYLYLLRARGRTLGALCCARTPGKHAEQKRLVGVVQRFVAMVAGMIAALQDASSWRATRTQYERWFRQLDQHIRVLDRERQKFAALVDQNDVYVFVADANRRIRWANRAVGLRFPIEEGTPSWIGRSCMDLCARFGEASGDGGCPACAALDTNKPAHGEFRQATDHGDRIMYATALPIKGPDGKPQEVIVMMQDLSELETLRKSEARLRELFEERRRAEEALDRTNKHLSAVVASSPIVLFATDREGVLTLSEGRGLEGLGRQPGESVGRSVFDLYRDVPVVAENIRRALRGQEFTALVEMGPVVFETHYAPIRDTKGEITGVLGVATDVTALRRGSLSPRLDAAA